MLLKDFTPLIEKLPVSQQAFRSKRKTWLRFDGVPHIGEAIRQIFGGEKDVLLSRDDISGYATNNDIDLFAVATIVWGYPRGMRGNHLRNISRKFEHLLECLRRARKDGIRNWRDHFFSIDIDGLGLSTYTKFLYFLDARVEGSPALILDNRIIKVASRELFSELAPLRSLGTHNASERYPDYLKCIHSVAKQLPLAGDAGVG